MMKMTLITPHGCETPVEVPESKLTREQEKKIRKEFIDPYDGVCTAIIKLRYDDSCYNGHNTFSITCDVKNKLGKWISGGCQHNLIAKIAPELEPYIKWHLCNSDGPLHYMANTVHFAGNKDCWGKVGNKERELDSARKSAIWPEATDEELCSPDLKEKLLARLPKLMLEFKQAMEELGFEY